jgi:DNA transformation protein
MFGGSGLFRNDLMFGLVADDEVYFKTDAVNLEEFESRGLEPFIYGPKQQAMSYRKPPSEALESTDLFCQWAEIGYAAAVRASSKKRRKTANKKKL